MQNEMSQTGLKCLFADEQFKSRGGWKNGKDNTSRRLCNTASDTIRDYNDKQYNIYLQMEEVSSINATRQI